LPPQVNSADSLHSQLISSLGQGYLRTYLEEAADLRDSTLNEARCTKSVQKRGYEKVADLITP
jgi:hypothetical protein